MWEVGGLFGLIVLVLDIWAIIRIIQGHGSTESKLLWVILIVLLPVLGLILWLALGRRAAA